MNDCIKMIGYKLNGKTAIVTGANTGEDCYNSYVIERNRNCIIGDQGFETANWDNRLL
jgi:hypothetical protein